MKGWWNSRSRPEKQPNAFLQEPSRGRENVLPSKSTDGKDKPARLFIICQSLLPEQHTIQNQMGGFPPNSIQGAAASRKRTGSALPSPQANSNWNWPTPHCEQWIYWTIPLREDTLHLLMMYWQENCLFNILVSSSDMPRDTSVGQECLHPPKSTNGD